MGCLVCTRGRKHLAQVPPGAGTSHQTAQSLRPNIEEEREALSPCCPEKVGCWLLLEGIIPGQTTGFMAGQKVDLLSLSLRPWQPRLQGENVAGSPQPPATSAPLVPGTRPRPSLRAEKAAQELNAILSFRVYPLLSLPLSLQTFKPRNACILGRTAVRPEQHGEAAGERWWAKGRVPLPGPAGWQT